MLKKSSFFNEYVIVGRPIILSLISPFDSLFTSFYDLISSPRYYKINQIKNQMMKIIGRVP